ncbi:hypothetical protein C8Q73DRAFT_692522 [Cubamyces lactineus]|nr:hypothetical protein C8Q73DRAFT_692522 [Cubamyces lactineus]
MILSSALYPASVYPCSRTARNAPYTCARAHKTIASSTHAACKRSAVTHRHRCYHRTTRRSSHRRCHLPRTAHLATHRTSHTHAHARRRHSSSSHGRRLRHRRRHARFRFRLSFALANRRRGLTPAEAKPARARGACGTPGCCARPCRFSRGSACPCACRGEGATRQDIEDPEEEACDSAHDGLQNCCDAGDYAGDYVRH